MKYITITFLIVLTIICSSCQESKTPSQHTPTPTPTEEPVSTPHNIIIAPTPTPASSISAVTLKILQNDKEAIVFGFDFLGADGQPVNFSGFRSAKFFGQIWQGHLDSPISYIVQVDSTDIDTNLDTITIPYSVLNFSGIDISKPVNVDFAVEGLAVKFNRYSFWISVLFTAELLELPTTINGNPSD